MIMIDITMMLTWTAITIAKLIMMRMVMIARETLIKMVSMFTHVNLQWLCRGRPVSQRAADAIPGHHCILEEAWD